MKRSANKKPKKAQAPEIDARVVPVVRAVEGVRGVSAGKLFSSYGLKVNEKIFAMFGRSGFVVKLPKHRVDELVSGGKGARFEPGPGRVMKEWVAFKGGEAGWVELAQEAYRFVRQAKQ